MKRKLVDNFQNELNLLMQKHHMTISAEGVQIPVDYINGVRVGYIQLIDNQFVFREYTVKLED